MSQTVERGEETVEMSANNKTESNAEQRIVSEQETENRTPENSDPLKDARQWFSGLSLEERVAALSFEDAPFVSALSKLSASSFSPHADHFLDVHNRTPDRRSPQESVDWSSRVSLAEMEELLKNVEGEAPLVEVIESTATNEVVVTEEKHVIAPVGVDKADGPVVEEVGPSNDDESGQLNSMSVDEDAGNQDDVDEVDPDDIRIRDAGKDTEEVETQDNEAPVNQDDHVDPNEETVASLVLEEIPASGQQVPQAHSIFDHACILQPKALSEADAEENVVQGDNSIVTLHPHFLSTTTAEDLLAAFDDYMVQGSFLSEPIHDSWTTAAREVTRSNDPTSIPFYMFLLLRFQYAVIDSYRNVTPTATTSTKTDKKDDSDEHQDQSDKPDESNPTVLETPSDEQDKDDEESPPSLPKESEEPSSPDSLRENEIPAKPPSIDVTPEQPPLSYTFANSIQPLYGKDPERFTELLKPLSAFIVGVEKYPISSKLPEMSTPQTPETAVSETVSVGQGTMPHIEVTVETVESTEEPNAEAMAVTEVPSKEGEVPTEGAAVDAEAEVEIETNVANSSYTTKKGNRRRRKKKKRKPVPVPGATPHAKSPSTPDKVQSETEPPTNTQIEESPSQVTSVEEAVMDTPQEVPALPTVVTPTNSMEVESPAVSREDVAAADAPVDEHKDAGTPSEPPADEPPAGATDSLQISRVDGVGTVVVAPSVPGEALPQRSEERSGNEKQGPVPTSGHDEDDWETVEVRSRGSRKKGGDGGHQRFSAGHHGHGGGNGSKKKAPRNAASRKRIANRKMVREILSSVLDSVEDHVRKRRQPVSENVRAPGNAWGAASSRKNSAVTKVPPSIAHKGDNRKEATMRDILIGKQGKRHHAVPGSGHQNQQKGHGARHRSSAGETGKKPKDKSAGAASAADQNTAPTLTETLSAVSTASPFTETPTAKNTQPKGAGRARCDSSSGGSIGAPKPQANSTQIGTEATPSPPLPTLLNAENANSASSSVASSLDTPHGVLHNRHSSSARGENDVGYHLLHVCDRLTRDIGQFMKRRDQALNIRRKERGLVLAALEESLTAIWPGMCSVEKYGSCATDLDLPSSDLDVVIRGLDQPSGTKKESEAGAGRRDMMDGAPQSVDGTSGDLQHPPMNQHQYQIMYGHMSPNAERVVRLAMELERQPWAAHVKAIPTATVPVIKVLADPARLTGTSEWLVHHGVPATGEGQHVPDGPESGVPGQFPASQAPLPWRGADVVNGLLKLDITFEGPEHGGIGSTDFSTRVVQEFSNETGVQPDDTAAVQVLMVLKEMLAQRRLNEPFSGGLSSYALLLLVISVVQERGIIRNELERVERQSEMVATGSGNGVPRYGHSGAISASSQKQTMRKMEGVEVQPSDSGTRHPKAGERKQGPSHQKQERGKSSAADVARETKPSSGSVGTLKRGNPASSSWASIARKTSPPPQLVTKASQDSAQSGSAEKRKQPIKKLGSFADAVANGSVGGGSATQSAAGGGSRQRKEGRAKVTTPAWKEAKGKATAEGGQTHTKAVRDSLPPVAPAPAPEGRSQGKGGSATTSKQVASPSTYDPGSLFPQGIHDVIEVLCSGETTPGKLFMHFLLFYGQHFESQSTSIDYSGTHERDPNANCGYSVLSAYMQRRTAGSYDPMTGMLTVDPIVVYDPLEGAETNNVARSCFAWSNIRWVFTQSYMTMSTAVEMSAGVTSGKGGNKGAGSGLAPTGEMGPAQAENSWNAPYGHVESPNAMADPASPLLELLLSY